MRSFITYILGQKLMIKPVKITWALYIACMGADECIRGFGGNLEVKRKLGTHRRMWENNIGTNLRKISWGMDWIPLTQNRDQRPALVNRQ
jgi:hypothetical protein